jgi:hypothetical protein
MKEKSAMSSKLSFALALLVGLFSVSAAQAGFDGSEPFLCAITETVSCTETGVCERGSAEDVGLPDFIMVDVPGKMFREHGDGTRSSPISSTQKLADNLAIHGVQDRAWSAIVTPDGHLSISAAGANGGFLLFGVCTEP